MKTTKLALKAKAQKQKEARKKFIKNFKKKLATRKVKKVIISIIIVGITNFVIFFAEGMADEAVSGIKGYFAGDEEVAEDEEVIEGEEAEEDEDESKKKSMKADDLIKEALKRK
ncbi:hypothetical protein [Candidatus Epulonipiscium viviparus]|uniref:hypothetical protein n=1 Tax=Candidatus Epulonipiscium viviparus TaxID=420336 RepID=UPI0027380590|nr:hypothetical protein [Candidatus Epulopiscium viviparus]